MTKSGFAIEKQDGRRRKRCFSDGEAPAGGGERMLVVASGGWLSGMGGGVRPPRSWLAILRS